MRLKMLLIRVSARSRAVPLPSLKPTSAGGDLFFHRGRRRAGRAGSGITVTIAAAESEV